MEKVIFLFVETCLCLPYYLLHKVNGYFFKGTHMQLAVIFKSLLPRIYKTCNLIVFGLFVILVISRFGLRAGLGF